jgi:hypothetical protein
MHLKSVRRLALRLQLQQQQRAFHSELLAHIASLRRNDTPGREQVASRSSDVSSPCDVSSPWSWLWRRSANPWIPSDGDPSSHSSVVHASTGPDLVMAQDGGVRVQEQPSSAPE